MNSGLVQSQFVSAGWLPGGDRPLALRPRHDLLRMIAERHGSIATSNELTDWLWQSIAMRRHLTWESIPEPVGLRFFWWPHGVRLGKRISIVSSRRSGSHRPQWFRTLADIVNQLNSRRDLLMTCAGTTCDPFVRHLAAVENLPSVQWVTARQTDATQWLNALRDSTSHHKSAAYVSPRIDGPGDSKVPERDQLLIGLADDVYVLRLRPNGNLWRLLLRRADGRQGNIILPAADRLIGDDLARRLFDLGATRFFPGCRRPTARASRLGVRGASNLATQTVAQVCSSDRLFMCHWTRSCDGPWPDQGDEQYLQQQFIDPWQDRSALSSLRRILRMQRILATDTLNRDCVPVVGFTERWLVEFADMRVYRRHLRRWDFEPYGIGIDARWLRQRGAARVIYGDEDDWERLSARQRPFFQPESEDWMSEREWRHIGDVDLRHLNPQDGFVFVPDSAAARQIALYSRWPIVRLET